MNPAHVGLRSGSLEILRGLAGFRCICKCHACGREIEKDYPNVVSGRHKSCGCTRMAAIAKAKRVHGDNGKVRASEHAIWAAIISRCYHPKNKCFKYYGARGISVCREWRESYPKFLADVGRRPSQTHSIDRIDVNGDYEPGNVRWATPIEQRRNRRDYLAKHPIEVAA